MLPKLSQEMVKDSKEALALISSLKRRGNAAKISPESATQLETNFDHIFSCLHGEMLPKLVHNRVNTQRKQFGPISPTKSGGNAAKIDSASRNW